MTDSWIILLGGNELNGGFAQLAKNWGLQLAVIDWNERPAITGDRHFRLDIKNADPILEAIRALGRIEFAYTSADVAMESSARINASAGLFRADAAAIDRSRNKVEMNDAWEKAGLLGKKSRACANSDDLRKFATDVGSTIIIKPVDSSSSRGITVVSKHEAQAANWEALYARSASASLRGGVLAEEFVEGTEFTVEMIGDSEGGVEVWGVSKKYHTAHTHKNRIAVKLHYNPPDVPHDKLEHIASFAARCYRALGLRSSLGHFEVIEALDGRLIPVELAARSSGYIATHLVSVLGGEPGAYPAAFRDVMRGATVKNRLVASPLSTMYFFYDPPPGAWVGTGTSIVDFLPSSIVSMAHLRDRLRPGTTIKHIDSDNERYGFEVLVGKASELTMERIATAEIALYKTSVVQEGRASLARTSGL